MIKTFDEVYNSVPQDKIVVVYHGPTCLDGIGAAWCFKQRFPYATYIVGYYQDDNLDLEIFRDKYVYLLDFSYPPEIIKAICAIATQVVMLDHHASALGACESLQGQLLNFDMSNCTIHKSGARLAWEYTSSEPCPPIIAFIEGRDLWKWELVNTKEITAALYSYDDVFTVLNDIKDRPSTIDKLLTEGIALVRARDKEVDLTVKYNTRLFISSTISVVYPELVDCEIPFVNTPTAIMSDVGNDLGVSYPLVVMYNHKARYVEFSLRSNKLNHKAVDVSELARYFGGGGHKHAAGFKLKYDHEWAKGNFNV